MYTQPITLSNGECDGFANSYCDQCGAEAYVTEVDGLDLCDNCKNENNENLHDLDQAISND